MTQIKDIWLNSLHTHRTDALDLKEIANELADIDERRRSLVSS